MEWITESFEKLTVMLTQMWDVLKVFGGVFELLAGLATFLGPLGFSLFLLSIVLLGFIGSFSPLSKLINYLIVVAGMVFLALSNGAEIASVGRYLIVMIAPVLVVYGILYLGRFLGRALFSSPKKERIRRAEELALQLSKEIAALKTA